MVRSVPPDKNTDGPRCRGPSEERQERKGSTGREAALGGGREGGGREGRQADRATFTRPADQTVQLGGNCGAPAEAGAPRNETNEARGAAGEGGREGGREGRQEGGRQMQRSLAQGVGPELEKSESLRKMPGNPEDPSRTT